MSVKLRLDQSLSCSGNRCLCSFWNHHVTPRSYPKAHHFLLINKIMRPQKLSISFIIIFWSLHYWARSLEAALCQASCQLARTFQQTEHPGVVHGFAEIRASVQRAAAASDLSCCTAWEVSLQDGGSCSFPPLQHCHLPVSGRAGGLVCHLNHTTILVCQSLPHVYGDESDHRKWGEICMCKRRGLTLLDRMVSVKEGFRCNIQ